MDNLLFILHYKKNQNNYNNNKINKLYEYLFKIVRNK
jgi:hypothetical protein